MTDKKRLTRRNRGESAAEVGTGNEGGDKRPRLAQRGARKLPAAAAAVRTAFAAVAAAAKEVC